ncbi:TSUP family transporter [Roseomonas sp. WA12]
MTPLLMLGLTVLMVGTALLSGVFGMAGGLVLIGVLLAVLPVADAMVLHAVTQMASNGWRAALWWRHVRFRPMAQYLLGALLALVVLGLVNFVPSRATALLMLGLTPFLVRLAPARLKPDPERLSHGVFYGAVCMALMILTGVSGPLMDSFFLGGKLERREIVATKAACQIFSHAGKLLYFGGLVSATGELDPVLAGLAVAASILGTTLAKPLLEMLSDTQYRSWAGRLITVIALYYVVQGAWEMFGA